MDVQVIGRSAFTVYIDGEELERRRLDPRSITALEARALVSSVIGCDPFGAVSLELYPGQHELLIFVRRSSGEPEFFSFEDFEELLGAVNSCADEPTSSLFYYDGRYILAVWGFDGQTGAAFSEFAESLAFPAGYLMHLREHGRTIAEGDAVHILRSCFSA